MSTKIKTPEGWKDVAGGTWCPRPDWANAIAVTVADLYAGYTAPGDGIIVCTGFMPNPETARDRIMTINGIRVARGRYTSTGQYVFVNVCCPVNKGDLIKTDTDSVWVNETRYFVPYKEQ